MPVIPNGWGQATCKFTGNNLPNGGAVVFGFKNDNDESALQCATDVYSCVAEHVDNLSSSDVTFSVVDVKLGPNDTGNIATYIGTPVNGAVGGTSLSPGTSLLFHKSSLFGGRRGRGRMYWPGVYDGWADDTGTLTSGVPATINTELIDLRQDLETIGVPMYLLHTPSYTWEIVGGQPRRVYEDPGSVPVPYEVTSLLTDTRVATQRRRLR